MIGRNTCSSSLGPAPRLSSFPVIYVRVCSIPLDDGSLYITQRFDAEQKPAIRAVKTVADQTGHSMAQVALAWLRSRPVPIIPIIGARKLSQLQDNLASLDLSLSAEQLKTLDEASRIGLGFPYYLYAKESSRAILYGGMRDRIIA